MVNPGQRLKAPRSATLTERIVAASLERTVRHQPVRLRNLAPTLSAEATPTSVDVTLRGNRDALNRMVPDDVMPFVDVSGLGAGDYTLTAHASASQDAGVVRIEPSSVKVRITSAKR